MKCGHFLTSCRQIVHLSLKSDWKLFQTRSPQHKATENIIAQSLPILEMQLQYYLTENDSSKQRIHKPDMTDCNEGMFISSFSFSSASSFTSKNKNSSKLLSTKRETSNKHLNMFIQMLLQKQENTSFNPIYCCIMSVLFFSSIILLF